MDHDVGKALLGAVVRQAQRMNLVSDEHFSVDGTLIQAWASMKSFHPKDGPKPPSTGSGSNAEVDFRGTKRSNDTHESKTDPECRLYKKAKGQESKLAYLGHALMENRSGLAVDGCVTPANGTAERDAAFEMVDMIKTDGPITLGADKGYDAAEFVERLGTARVIPHIAQNTTGRRSAVADRIARTPAYALSQLARKRIEEIFGWAKEIGGMAQTKLRGRAHVDWRFTMTPAAYNLIRPPSWWPHDTGVVRLQCGKRPENRPETSREVVPARANRRKFECAESTRAIYPGFFSTLLKVWQRGHVRQSAIEILSILRNRES